MNQSQSAPGLVAGEDLLYERLLVELRAGDFVKAGLVADELECLGLRKQALVGRALIAERLHDANSLRAIAESDQSPRNVLCDEPRLLSFVARAIYWTCGLASAADLFQSLCQSDALERGDDVRREACALAALAKLLGEKAPRRIEDGLAASADFAGGVPLLAVLATINDQQEEYFVIDTGAPTSLISRRYADRVGIGYITESSKTAYDGGGNEVTLFPALIDRLRIGGLSIRNSTAYVAELSPKFKVAGIISPLDTFRDLLTEIDMRNRRLVLQAGLSDEQWRSRAGEPVFSTPLIWEGGNVFVTATVNDSASGWFILDTGAASDLASKDLTSRLGIQTADSAVESATAGGLAQVLSGFEGTLRIGEAADVASRFLVKDRTVDPDAIAPLTSSGYVGLPWMTGRRIALPPGGKSLLFTEPK